jgi:predicted MFS family arabinose efflux permease
MLSKKIGEDRIFKGAFIVQATASILYAIAPNKYWLYIIPFYQILSRGSFNQMAMSKASNMVSKERQGDALGRYMAIMSTGMFIGPLISSFLLFYLNYRQLFMVSSIFPLIALIVFNKTISQYGNHESMEIEEAPVRGGLRKVLQIRNIQILTWIRATYSLTNTMFTTLFALYATQYLGYTESRVALLFSIMGFTNAVVKIPAGYIGDRLNPKKVLLATFTSLILVFVALAIVQSYIMLAVTLFLFGICWGTRAVNEWATLAKTVSPENKSIAMSYMSSIWGVGATIGSILAGILAENLSYTAIFLLSAAINLPSIPALLLLRQPNNKNSVH